MVLLIVASIVILLLYYNYGEKPWQRKKNWNRSLDLIKTVAIITVLMTHISASFVIKYPSSSPEFIWGNIVDSLSRIGVPLFLMVSGSLFLDGYSLFVVGNHLT